MAIQVTLIFLKFDMRHGDPSSMAPLPSVKHIHRTRTLSKEKTAPLSVVGGVNQVSISPTRVWSPGVGLPVVTTLPPTPPPSGPILTPGRSAPSCRPTPPQSVLRQTIAIKAFRRASLYLFSKLALLWSSYRAWDLNPGWFQVGKVGMAATFHDWW